jgi:hypothetical protein
VRANAKNLLALDVERKVILHPLFVVPPDVPKHVPRPRRERGGSIPRPSVVPNVHPIREPVLVPDRIVAFLRAHLPRLAGLDIEAPHPAPRSVGLSIQFHGPSWQ